MYNTRRFDSDYHTDYHTDAESMICSMIRFDDEFWLRLGRAKSLWLLFPHGGVDVSTPSKPPLENILFPRTDIP